MHRNDWKGRLIEASAFIAVAVIAFVGGLLIGDLGASPKTETILATPSNGGEEDAEAPEATEEAAEVEEVSSGGAQVFASTGCGSCHTFKAANSTGTVGPNLNEYLAPDDNQAGIEEMIVDPNGEIAEGYSANVMPQEYGQALSKQELDQLVHFLIENSPAGGAKPEGPGGEEQDIGGPTN
jgi:mono/diheme cytochrome c family protein